MELIRLLQPRLSFSKYNLRKKLKQMFLSKICDILGVKVAKLVRIAH